VTFDPICMDCETIQAALSARADGEPAGVAEPLVDRHVRTCADCAGFARVIAGMRTQLAPEGRRDLSPGIVAVAARVDRGGVWWGLRAALFSVAVGELILAVPDLVARASEGAGDIHMQRHLGAFQTAYAIGLIVVALRPAKARALVPLTAALAAAMIGASIVDIAQGVTPALGEWEHSLELLGLILVWLLAARRGWPGSARRSEQVPRPTLVVAEESDRLMGKHSA
jgi:predicted anti-sigma-YlaC factor YlaD